MRLGYPTMAKRKTPDDPLERKRQELVERERELSAQLEGITQSISQEEPGGVTIPTDLVWKEDPDELNMSPLDSPVRRRELARKRAQDRFLFFMLMVVCVGLLYGLTILVQIYYVPHAHVLSDLGHLEP
jgi:hypothetical protein